MSNQNLRTTNGQKMVIAGIGGVGGYFGGLLAKYYQKSDSTKIVFLARGEHLAQIQNHGLKVIKGEDVFIAKPHFATASANEIGIADYLIICTKNYDLIELLPQLSSCIGPETILVPLLNGVSGVEIISAFYPDNLVVAGCAYIVAAIQSPGVIENMGTVQKVFFGLNDQPNERLGQLANLMQQAGIEATFSQQISTVVWEKFIFLASIATATSYFNRSVGQLLKEHQTTLVQLIDEVTAVAIQKGIAVSPDMVAKAMAHYQALPFDATSSMHRDYLQHKPKTELESLTGYVVSEGEKLDVPTPLFKKAYEGLKNNT